MKLSLLALLPVLLVLTTASVTSAQEKPVPITVTSVWLDGFPPQPPPPSPTPKSVAQTVSTTPTPSPSPTPTPDTSTPTTVHRIDAGLRDRIWVAVEGLTEAVNARDLVLYLNGQEVKNTKPVAIKGPNDNWLAFDLVRNDQSDSVWRSLLGSPSEQYRAIDVSVGFADKTGFRATPGVTKHPFILLHVVHLRWVFICFAILILLVFLFVRRAQKGGFIHDVIPPNPPPGKLKPYSLALTQAAWWFFLVIASFAFIYMITSDYNTMTDQALILMGIGAGTALGSFMVSASKRDTADSQLSTLRPQAAQLEAEIKQLKATTPVDTVGVAAKEAKLAELSKQIDDATAGLSKPVSEGFFNDILTDVNGVALHRFQMAVWTLVLGVIFVVAVYRNLAMPEFSVTLLALMGISAGTYLGFKIPEKQNDPNDQQNP